MARQSEKYADEIRRIPGAQLLQDAADGYGNVLLRVGEGADSKFLKLYRRRQGAVAGFFAALSHRLFEGKRGTSPAARFETERVTMQVWSRHGFDVFRRLDLPLPEGVRPPGMWLEFVEGRTLFQTLRDSETTPEERDALVRRLGAELGRRFRLVLEHGERLLVQEHGTVQHVWLAGSRWIWFDFEGGYRSGYPLDLAIMHELSGIVRSMAVAGEAALPDSLGSLVAGCAEPDILRRAADLAVNGKGLALRLRRWQDRRRQYPKTEMMRLLLDALIRAQH